MISLFGSTEEFFPAWHRYMFCDDHVPRFRHEDHPGSIEHICGRWHSQCFGPKKFYQCPADRQNKVSDFSYRPWASTQPDIQGSFPWSYPCHSDRHPIFFLLSLNHNDLQCKPPTAGQALDQGGCKQHNNQGWWGASFPAFQFLF